jgi:hypothetical protein
MPGKKLYGLLSSLLKRKYQYNTLWQLGKEKQIINTRTSSL